MKIKNRKNGFSLIEVLIAVTFVGICMVGMLSFFSSSLKSNADAKNDLIAAALAQEGAELMRNLAEYKKLHDNASWTVVKASLAACNGRIDYRSLLNAHPCNLGGNYICFSSGRYQQCGTVGDIQRIVTISDQGSNGLAVTSQVIWNGRTTTATDRLYENNY